MGQVDQRLQLSAQIIQMGGQPWAEQALGRAAAHRATKLLVNVQWLPWPPAVDDVVDGGHHGGDIVLHASVPQSGRHGAAETAVILAVADDQCGRSINGHQALERLAPAERVGIGEHEPVRLGAQQIDETVAPDSRVDECATAPI